METTQVPRWLLLVGIAGPLVLVGGVVFVIQLNNWLMTFDYDLLYVTCEGAGPAPTRQVLCGQYMEQRYVISEGQLIVRDEIEVYERIFGSSFDQATESTSASEFMNWTTRLYVHDAKRNRSQEITPEELVGRVLTASRIAPDGTQLRHEQQYYGSPFFLFSGSGSRSSHVLIQGDARREVTLLTPTDRWGWPDQFHHLGWVARSD